MSLLFLRIPRSVVYQIMDVSSTEWPCDDRKLRLTAVSIKLYSDGHKRKCKESVTSICVMLWSSSLQRKGRIAVLFVTTRGQSRLLPKAFYLELLLETSRYNLVHGF